MKKICFLTVIGIRIYPNYIYISFLEKDVKKTFPLQPNQQCPTSDFDGCKPSDRSRVSNGDMGIWELFMCIKLYKYVCVCAMPCNVCVYEQNPPKTNDCRILTTCLVLKTVLKHFALIEVLNKSEILMTLWQCHPIQTLVEATASHPSI